MKSTEGKFAVFGVTLIILATIVCLFISSPSSKIYVSLVIIPGPWQRHLENYETFDEKVSFLEKVLVGEGYLERADFDKSSDRENAIWNATFNSWEKLQRLPTEVVQSYKHPTG